MLTAKADSAHLDRMRAHYRRARARLDKLARDRALAMALALADPDLKSQGEAGHRATSTLDGDGTPAACIVSCSTTSVRRRNTLALDRQVVLMF